LSDARVLEEVSCKEKLIADGGERCAYAKGVQSESEHMKRSRNVEYAAHGTSTYHIQRYDYMFASDVNSSIK